MNTQNISAKQLRVLWLSFWKEKKHFVIPSHSLVSSDKSLFWINSGVAGLRNYFLGLSKPPNKRLVNIQKAVRTNDINNIGKTNRHLSFFEMLGNFSFGDYQKRHAILWAWEFLTSLKWLGIDSQKLYVNVYEKDQQAIEICKKDLQLAPDHLILCNYETNFWDLGVGPCGPNLEFFYDLGSSFDPEQKGTELLKTAQENDRYIEIWNIVFSEFVNLGNNNYQPLPTKNIDTGAGLERLLMVLQNKNNCFETDLFTKLISFLSKKLQISFCLKKNNLTKLEEENNSKLKIIADHARSTLFLLTDLLQETKKIHWQGKRGYVIKKLIRNAVLQSVFLNYYKPILSLTFPIINNEMSDFYPELNLTMKEITTMVFEEEKKFLKILSNKSINNFLSLKPSTKITGAELFRLVTEVGLPFSFLVKIAQEKKLFLDIKVFNTLLKAHQLKSQTNTKKFVLPWQTLFLPKSKTTDFIETSTTINNVKILAIFNEQKLVKEVGNSECWMIFSKTPFYAQRGGQVADSGWVILDNERYLVLDVQVNAKGQYLHLVDLKGQISVDNLITLSVDNRRRTLIRNNHSATHLLHFALRSVLGFDIKQNGSLNNENYLRLDFSTSQKHIVLDRFVEVEKKVNFLLQKGTIPKIVWMSLARAKKSKALNFFNVKPVANGKVRVVHFDDYSVELCGGLHVFNTNFIENFLLTKVKKISENNYRVYALTTQKVIHHFLNDNQQEFDAFLQLHNLNWDKLMKDPEFTPLCTKLLKNKYFYLLRQKYQNELRVLVKKKQLQIDDSKITKTISQYQIPKHDFHLGLNYQLIFHSLDLNYHQQKEGILILRKLFDQYKKQPKTLLFLFTQNDAQKWNFIFQFNLESSTIDWKLYLEEYFGKRIKFGFKENKCQGVLFGFKPKCFLLDLKQHLLKKLV